MIPDSIRQRYQTQVRPQFDRASGEVRKVLKDLGVAIDEERSLKEVITQIRAKNPTFREFTLNLDMAT
jgi:DNA-binding FrmR family transcriptional regulator